MEKKITAKVTETMSAVLTPIAVASQMTSKTSSFIFTSMLRKGTGPETLQSFNLTSSGNYDILYIQGEGKQERAERKAR